MILIAEEELSPKALTLPVAPTVIVNDILSAILFAKIVVVLRTCFKYFVQK